MKSDPTLWLLARAAGLAAYGLVTASVLAGLTLRSRPAPSRLRPAAVADVHKTLALLGLGALALHGAALALDAVARISPEALVVPGLAPRDRLAVALGVVAGDLMLVVILSSSLRRRIGFRVWRRMHWLTFAIFAGASAHGIMAGTDSPRPAVVWMYAAAVAAVVGATAWRVMTAPARGRRPAARATAPQRPAPHVPDPSPQRPAKSTPSATPSSTLT
ncbi:MAG: methionine sulfoxide reductase heme-binding subunit [Gaiellales bacterium]|nr:methionine sulfoxide reductase heme-binding subunit [Gaiellales bacterium]